MPNVHVMSVIGSAVPAPLRADGLLACWYVVIDGVPVSGPFTSRAEAHINAAGDSVEPAITTPKNIPKTICVKTSQR